LRIAVVPMSYELLLQSVNSYLLIVAGLVALYYGADWMVDSSCSIAMRFGVPPVMVGLTIVAAGTSMPEAVVSVQATLNDKGGLSIGNVIGSNTLNIALVLGLSAMLQPLEVARRVVKADIPTMILLSFLVFVFFEDHVISRWEGMFLLLCMVSYILGNIVAAREEEGHVGDGVELGESLGHDLTFLIVGMALLAFGSDWLVVGSVDVARDWGVSDAVIGLTVVAIGTSSPELVTSVVAAYKKHADLAVGNAVGSNISNLCFVLGTAGTVRPLDGSGVETLDFLIMLLFALIMLPTAWTGYSLDRKEGVAFVGIYVVYLFLIWPF
jgi:cation:H+ antiporter